MAFNPELGSTSPAVLLDNAERLDKLVNGSALTEPDRAGDDLNTWRGMMVKNEALTEETRQNLILSAASMRRWLRRRRISRIFRWGRPRITVVRMIALSLSRS